MDLELRGKVALVTGAGKGMGLAAAQAFAAEGAKVVVSDIDAALAEQVAQQLRTDGHEALGVRCDVSVEADVQAMVEQAVATFGSLDAAFNNAGVQSPAVETADADSEEFDRHIAINLKGVWLCMKYELLQMRRQKSGAIVNNSSIGGIIGLPGRAIYHAAKHGVLGMTKSAALEYATRGITINAVCPGTIDTPMVQAMTAENPQATEGFLKNQPNGRMGRPEEVASAVVWLCGAGARYVLGHALVVDGGLTVQ
jgi:NAD(P)-dependent dehydrogenase (short-subunit alcohol dehydrogenase family)